MWTLRKQRLINAIAGKSEMRLEEWERPEARNTSHSTSVEVDGRMIEIDAEGYLIHATDWSRAVTEALAESDGVELREDHWLLIDFLHRFYAEYEIAPDMPILSRNLCKDQEDCSWTRALYQKAFSRWRQDGLPLCGSARPRRQKLPLRHTSCSPDLHQGPTTYRSSATDPGVGSG